MTRDEIYAAVVSSLRSVAPEVDPAELERDEPLRDQVDIDSMDFLNFLIALNEATGVEIPEADYPKIETPDDCVDYVANALG